MLPRPFGGAGRGVPFIRVLEGLGEACRVFFCSILGGPSGSAQHLYLVRATDCLA